MQCCHVYIYIIHTIKVLIFLIQTAKDICKRLLYAQRGKMSNFMQTFSKFSCTISRNAIHIIIFQHRNHLNLAIGEDADVFFYPNIQVYLHFQYFRFLIFILDRTIFFLKKRFIYKVVLSSCKVRAESVSFFKFYSASFIQKKRSFILKSILK